MACTPAMLLLVGWVDITKRTISVPTEKGKTMREKLIDLLTAYFGVDPAYYGIEAAHLADHLIANGVTILDKTDMPKTSKRQFYYDSNLGWYFSMQIDWLGQSFYLAQQIPKEPSAYINAIWKNALKEENANERKADGTG